jgi:hypothetical protein
MMNKATYLRAIQFTQINQSIKRPAIRNKDRESHDSDAMYQIGKRDSGSNHNDE